MMRGSSIIPKQFRNLSTTSDSVHLGWLNRQITSGLLWVSHRVCLHPIHTIVFVALIASTSYVGLLDGSLLEISNDSKYGPGQVDVRSLLEGGRSLRLAEQTAWRWQMDGRDAMQNKDDVRCFSDTFRAQLIQ